MDTDQRLENATVVLSVSDLHNQKATVLFLAVQPLLFVMWLEPLKVSCALKYFCQFSTLLWASFICSPYFVGYDLVMAELGFCVAVVYMVWTRSKRVSPGRLAFETFMLVINGIALHILGFWSIGQFIQMMHCR